MTRIEEMTLEEKVDEILRFQRRAHRMAIVKSMISIALFVVLVIIPLVGFYYWIQDFQENFGMSMTEVGDTLKRVDNITELDGLDSLKNFLQ